MNQLFSLVVLFPFTNNPTLSTFIPFQRKTLHYSMAHTRPHGSSSPQPPPAHVPLPTDRSPAFIQSLLRAASESASSHSGVPSATYIQHQYTIDATQPYHPPPTTGATIVPSVNATGPAPRRSSNASLAGAPPRIKENNNQPLPHLPVIRLVDRETSSITTPVQGAGGETGVVSGGIIGPHDNSNSIGHTNNPPLQPRIQAPSSSSSSSTSSLSV